MPYMPTAGDADYDRLNPEQRRFADLLNALFGEPPAGRRDKAEAQAEQEALVEQANELRDRLECEE